MGELLGTAQDFGQIATPGTPPPSGFSRMYPKSDGMFYLQNSAGIETGFKGDVIVVDAAASTNITLSGTQTVDGVALSVGMTCAPMGQSTPSQNGVYIVQTNAWVRHPYADTAFKCASLEVSVRAGTTNGGANYQTTWRSTDTLNTTSMYWARLPSHTYGTTAPGSPAVGDFWSNPSSPSPVLTAAYDEYNAAPTTVTSGWTVNLQVRLKVAYLTLSRSQTFSTGTAYTAGTIQAAYLPVNAAAIGSATFGAAYFPGGCRVLLSGVIEVGHALGSDKTAVAGTASWPIAI